MGVRRGEEIGIPDLWIIMEVFYFLLFFFGSCEPSHTLLERREGEFSFLLAMLVRATEVGKSVLCVFLVISRRGPNSLSTCTLRALS